VMGEVGLTGEVRRVSFIEKRIREAEKLGFNIAIIPKANMKDLNKIDGINIIGVNNVLETLDIVLEG
ncbi:DNA repair protein RadA, partial [Anaerosalibacter bizertensis]|nr:DNA repair protein RadA [Anaerosalibacter bizertensis]